MNFIVTLTEKGQLTVPKPFREDLRLGPGDTLLVKVENDALLLDKPHTPNLAELDAKLPPPNGTGKVMTAQSSPKAGQE